jgi:hypothetical protein
LAQLEKFTGRKDPTVITWLKTVLLF